MIINYVKLILYSNFQFTLNICLFSSAFSTRLGYEEHIPGQTRDWNEEIQTTRELPRKSLPERLIRERAIFKVKPANTRLLIFNFWMT